MPETPAPAPAPRRTDVATPSSDILNAAEFQSTGETLARSKSERLRTLLPNVSSGDFDAVLASLRASGTFDRLLALLANPSV